MSEVDWRFRTLDKGGEGHAAEVTARRSSVSEEAAPQAESGPLSVPEETHSRSVSGAAPEKPASCRGRVRGVAVLEHRSVKRRLLGRSLCLIPCELSSDAEVL